MDQVQVKIKGMVITAKYGTLNTGDVLRTDAAFAKHLVDDCNAAEYVNQQKESAGEGGEQLVAVDVKPSKKSKGK